jgi:hypothetical protein
MADEVPRQDQPLDEDDALAALAQLVDQIRGSDYRDRHGHPLEMNLHYRDAVALLTLRGLWRA